MFAYAILRLRVAIVRFLMSYNDRRERAQRPQPPPPTHIETIPSSSSKGFVQLHYYFPPQKTFIQSAIEAKHPVVINFHGGGFSSGNPSMDDRWIAILHSTATTDPVVVSVDYSLAPEFPFPAAWQDASSVITYLTTDGAAKHNLDPGRIVLSGWSAGGTLALGTPLWMHDQHKASRGQYSDTRSISVLPSLRDILSIYPQSDYRLPRLQAPSFLLRFLGTTWDLAFAQRSPLDLPFISLSAASDELLQAALPNNIALYPVAWDPLCGPIESFKDRLLSLGKRVTCRVEPEAFHAWDKVPLKASKDDGDGADATASRRWAKREAWFTRMAKDVDDMLR